MLQIIPNWHPIFVHFSVALLSVAAGLHLVSHFVAAPERAGRFVLVARWNLWMGAGFTLLTLGAGWYAYYTVNHDAPSHAAMKAHASWALATAAIFFSIVIWEVLLQRHKQGRSWLFTGLLLAAAGLLVTTAWHGGELVYRYGLGVMSLPKSEGEGHAHEHGDGKTQSHDAMPMEGTVSGGAEHRVPHGHDSATSHHETGNAVVPAGDHHDAPGAPPHPH